MTKRAAFLMCSLLLAAPGTSFAQNINLIDYTFAEHFNPGDTITFTARIRNDDTSTFSAYVDFVLTNSATGAFTDNATSAASLAPGASATLTATATATAGLFTVTVIVFETAATDTETDRQSSPVPIHVGTATQELSVFPKVFDFGTIPPGRNMLPQPLKVTYDFFLFNRLGLDQPFYIRIYTDNGPRYKGIPGAITQGSPAGLVSSDGKYAIPLKVWTLNYGPGISDTGWNPAIMGPPPVEDDIMWKGPLTTKGTHDEGRVAWQRVPDYSEMTANNDSWRLLIHQDPYDTESAIDSNQTGDATLDSPFDVYLATEAGPTSVKGDYHARIVIELFTP